MASPKVQFSRQRSSTGSKLKESTTEDQALNTIAKEAEARLAAKRTARAEARSIRMKELERRQKEVANQQLSVESDADSESEYRHSRSKSMPRESNATTGTAGRDFLRHYSVATTGKEYNALVNGGTREHSSGRSSGRSTPESNGYLESQLSNLTATTLNHAATERELARLRETVREGEDKYKRAMMNAAQLDNERQAFQYHVELLKDMIEEMGEQMENVNSELLAKTRDYNKLNRELVATQAELDKCLRVLEERERVMTESGLNSDGTYKEGYDIPMDDDAVDGHCRFCRSRSSSEDGLGGTGDSGLGIEIRERGSLLAEITSLKSEITDLKAESRWEETRKEADATKRTMQTHITELKTQIQVLEQQNAQKDGLLVRLETQVKRYKQQADAAESMEDNLLAEKRKISRELRQAQEQIVDLENEKDQLKKRLEKMRSRRGIEV